MFVMLFIAYVEFKLFCATTLFDGEFSWCMMDSAYGICFVGEMLLIFLAEFVESLLWLRLSFSWDFAWTTSE